MFNAIRRLTRLPPTAQRKIVIGQLLPTLMHAPELHTKPSDEGVRLAAQMARSVAMEYHGSSRGK